MENKVALVLWPIDKMRHVRLVRFRAPFTRSSSYAEIIYTLPLTLDKDIVEQIDNFVLKAIREYDCNAVMGKQILLTEEQKEVLIRTYQNCRKTTFIVYNNPDSSDVMDSFKEGRKEWWSFRVQVNVYVSPYVENVDFQVYENSGSFMNYRLCDENATENLMVSIWDNARTLEEL